MKRLLFSLLFLLCFFMAGAQKKSEVFADVRKTVDEYFMPDFNDAVELPAWRDPANGKGLSHCSSVYIEPNHFFRNGKVCISYAAWVDRYCSESLHGRVVEHVLTLDEDMQKVRGDNDLYRIGATLVRRWVGVDGPDIPAERLTLTFQWRGAGRNVYIMHLDGDIRPLQLPAPEVVAPVTVVQPAKPEASSAVADADTDGISDSSLVGYFFEELWAEFVKQKETAFWLTAGFFLIALVAVVWDRGEKLSYWLRISGWLEPLGIAIGCTVLFFIFWFGIVGGVILAFNMCMGKHKPGRVRLELLESYDSYRVAAPDRAVAVARDGKWGLVDFKGALTCPMALDSITGFGGGCAVGWAAGRAALVPLGRPVTDLGTLDWYSNISPLVNGKALIEDGADKKSPSYYLFDSSLSGSQAFKVLPYQFISFRQTELNRYVCSKDKKVWGIIDGEGNVIVEPVYKRISKFSDGLARVTAMNNKQGFVDMGGDVVVPAIYSFIIGFHEGLATVSNEKSKYGFVDTEGNVIIPLIYENASSFHEGLAAVADEKYRWGYVDKSGKLVIPFKYIYAGGFSEGLAVVRNEKGHYGYINKEGRLVIPFKFIHASDFKGGRAEVGYSNKRWGVIDKKGHVISTDK